MYSFFSIAIYNLYFRAVPTYPVIAMTTEQENVELEKFSEDFDSVEDETP